MTELYIERRSLENLILFHASELRQIHSGEASARILIPGVRRKMVEYGILVRHRKRNRAHHTVTKKALIILDSEASPTSNLGQGGHAQGKPLEKGGGGVDVPKRLPHLRRETRS